MPHCDTPFGTLYYADHGKAHTSYVPVVLIHGAASNRLTWSAQLRRLPDRRVIALDLPGHGKSSQRGDQPVSVAGYAQAVIALLDELGIHQFIAVGHSMGGAIAQRLALTYPDRVAGLVLIGTGSRLAVNPKILETLDDDPQTVVGWIHKWSWAPTTPDDLRAAAYEALQATPPALIRADYAACDAFDVSDRLGDISAPTLVISGSLDKMTPPTLGQDLAAGIPHTQFVLIEGGGHSMHLEQAEAVAKTVRQWLEAIP